MSGEIFCQHRTVELSDLYRIESFSLNRTDSLDGVVDDTRGGCIWWQADVGEQRWLLYCTRRQKGGDTARSCARSFRKLCGGGGGWLRDTGWLALAGFGPRWVDRDVEWTDAPLVEEA